MKLNKYPNTVLLQILQSRRSECENQNTDPVVWTCRRIIKWIKDIDLKVPLRENSSANGESVGVGIWENISFHLGVCWQSSEQRGSWCHHGDGSLLQLWHHGGSFVYFEQQAHGPSSLEWRGEGTCQCSQVRLSVSVVVLYVSVSNYKCICLNESMSLWIYCQTCLRDSSLMSVSAGQGLIRKSNLWGLRPHFTGKVL